MPYCEDVPPTPQPVPEVGLPYTASPTPTPVETPIVTPEQPYIGDVLPPEIFPPIGCDPKINPGCDGVPPETTANQGEIYFSYYPGGTCNSSDYETLYWSGDRRFYSGLQLYSDPALTIPWNNSQNWNYCNFIGGDGREFDFQGGAGSSVVGNETGIGC